MCCNGFHEEIQRKLVSAIYVNTVERLIDIKKALEEFHNEHICNKLDMINMYTLVWEEVLEYIGLIMGTNLGNNLFFSPILDCRTCIYLYTC